MVVGGVLFRVRGKKKNTGRDVFLTKSWANNYDVAFRDMMIFGDERYDDLRIVKKSNQSFFNEINSNKRKRLPLKHYY